MRAIDAWVNVEMPARAAAWQEQAARQFKRSQAEVFAGRSLQDLLPMMDAVGVDKAVVTVALERPSAKVLALVDAHPERLRLSVLVDPRGAMRAVRELESLRRQHPVCLARVIPCMLNLPPDDRTYYPMYAKCVELGLAVSVNTGIPGPALPGRCQDPMALDDVCLFFPDLVLIMAHGADPWWEVAVRLMLKYPNLYLMTSACAPKYLPAALLHYMNTRGQHKVMFASDYPFLTMERCLAEACALELRPGVLEKYLYANAEQVLFGPLE